MTDVTAVTRESAQLAIDAKTKPLGALGRLEEIAVRLAILQQTPSPTIERTRVCVFAADHGVVDEGVSAYPRAVTAEMTRNFDRGGAAINVIARANSIDVEVVDVGVDAELGTLANIRHAKVRRGSRNFLLEPAMTREELDAALAAGASSARAAADSGVHALGLGEMGIGNTTSAAALLSALTRQSAAITVGRGTGITDEAMARKRAVVDRALQLYGNRSEERDARECLRCVGGLELAAIAGAALEAARQQMVVIADGFISTVSVLCAAAIAADESVELLSAMRAAVFFAHRSAECGHGLALEACQALLGESARPLLDLDMRLGEGTGAALAMPLLRSAAAVMREMATFASAGVSRD
jgi:nicotinate-nucleotide--dimethylbenzimidazole phosphoribosyltransferase